MRFSSTRVEAAVSLRAQGLTIPQIAASLKIHRRTVNKLLSKARSAEDGEDSQGDAGERRSPVPDDLIPETPVEAIEALQAATMVEIGRIAAEQAAEHAVHPDLIARTAAALQKIAALSRQIKADAADDEGRDDAGDYDALFASVEKLIQTRAEERARQIAAEEREEAQEAPFE